IICTVHISAYNTTVFGAVESLPWSDPLSTKDMLLFILWIIHRYPVQVKEACLARIRLFCDLDLDPNQRSLIRDHLTQELCVESSTDGVHDLRNSPFLFSVTTTMKSISLLHIISMIMGFW